MIVVDTNVLVHLFLDGDRADDARELARQQPDWVAPLLWRSEFRSVLAQYMRGAGCSLSAARQVMRLAEQWMRGKEYAVRSADVLSLVDQSRCSAYDCEFVALAEEIGIPLITTDRRLMEEFPDTVAALGE